MSTRTIRFLVISLLAIISTTVVACGDSNPQTVVETVIVEKQVPGPVVVETVIVEKAGEKVVETVVVEKIIVVTSEPAPVVAGPRRGGVLTIAVPSVATKSGLPRDCPACSINVAAGVQETLLTVGTAADGTASYGPGLALSWSIAPDLSYSDFVIRDDIEFHQGFGTLSASDVAWTFNQGNPNVTPDSIHDTIVDAAPNLSRVDVIDDNTVRFQWSQFTGFAHLKFLTEFHEGIGIFPEAAFDQMGADWMRDNVIGTGPFEMVEHEQNKGITARAVMGHWRKTPDVDEIRFLEIPEGSSRRAMLETGAAQIADIEFKDWPAMVGEGGRFKRAEQGMTAGISFVFGGNYWETVHPTSGDALDFEIKTELPWVGDPNDPADMESATKVRQALSMTIDRDGINESLLNGLGVPQYIGSISTVSPLFQSEWKIPFDPAAAKKLMEEAGYPDGFGDMDWYVGPPGTPSEAATAIAADWATHLNVNVTLDLQAYATFRPSRINRSSHKLSMFGACCAFPVTWSEEWLVSAVARPLDGARNGFNSGMELPRASEALALKAETTDIAELAKISVDYHDYLSEQALWPGIAQRPFSAVYDPEAIAGWIMRPLSNAALGGARYLEFVRLTDR